MESSKSSVNKMLTFLVEISHLLLCAVRRKKREVVTTMHLLSSVKAAIDNKSVGPYFVELRECVLFSVG